MLQNDPSCLAATSIPKPGSPIIRRGDDGVAGGTTVGKANEVGVGHFHNRQSELPMTERGKQSGSRRAVHLVFLQNERKQGQGRMGVTASEEIVRPVEADA